jgi:rhodanese-related sulfurtransferase
MTRSNLPEEISARELNDLLRSEPDTVLLDCREPEEHEIGLIAGSHRVPMNTIPFRIESWNAWREQRMVVVCHHGVRSLRVVHFLRAKGFERVQSLQGGIEAWSCDVDPSVPRY